MIINLVAKIEAFLFARGEAIQISALSEILGVSEMEIESALRELEKNYAGEGRGLVLLRSPQEGVALGTKPIFGEDLKKIFSGELRQELTPAALEALAIIAYRGPISRPEIDAIRGVNSIFMIRNLMIRGLVGRAPDEKRPNLWRYEVTLDCLKMLGISRKEDLPDFMELSRAFGSFESGTDSALNT